MTFPEFWAAYPRKVDKAGARTLYKSITSGGVTVTDSRSGDKVLLKATEAELDAWARHYARECEDIEPRYRLHARTGLHQERWHDAEPEAQDGTTAVRAALWGEITALEDKKNRAVLNEIEAARLKSLRGQIEAIKHPELKNVVRLHG